MSDPLKFAPAPNPKNNQVAYWLAQIQAANKREEAFLKEGKNIIEIYEGKKKDEIPFNILYSNTETLAPAVYNEVPRPVVSQRYKDEDPVGKLAAQALERVISFTIDNPTQGYEGLHSLFGNATLSSLVPGRGAIQFFYDADISGLEEPVTATGTKSLEEGDIDGQESKTAVSTDPKPLEKGVAAGQNNPAAMPQVKYEAVCARAITWDQIRYGYAKRWADVPWVALYFDMTKKDVEKSFGKGWAGKLKYGNEKDPTGTKKADDQKRPENTTRVWEIWHKSARKIIYFSESYGDSVIKTEEDPLKLSDFYSIPEPLVMMDPVVGLVPIPLYRLYEQQAMELNRLTSRIKKITEALKVRGFYDKGVGAIKELLSKEDNTLIAATGVGQFKDGYDLNKSIWLMPIESLANVLQQLQQQRQLVKQVIYEITGISDILRGSSVASETATAQNIKNQWGSLRLKRSQKQIQNFVRRCFRTIAEIASEHFSEETFKQMTGMGLMTSQEKQQATAQLQALQQQQAQAQQTPPGMEGQPPASAGAPGAPPPGPPPSGPAAPGQGEGTSAAPPPPPDPLAQQIQQLSQQVSQPSWGDVLAVLKNDVTRAYKVDIETNSTIDPEAVEDRQAAGEMMQALAQIMQQTFPAVQSGAMTMPAFKSILKGAMKRFRFGTEVETAISEMPDQLPPPPPDPKIQVAKMQLDHEAQMAQQGTDPKTLQAQQKLQEDSMALEMERKEFDMEKKFAMKELEMQKKAALAEIKMAQQAAKLEQDKQQAANENALAQKQFQGEQALTQKTMAADAQHQQRTLQLNGSMQVEKAGMKEKAAKAAGGPDPALVQILQHLTAPKPPAGKKRIRASRQPDGSSLYEEQ
jgi:hypothetical protein